jgi:hypothetical protein
LLGKALVSCSIVVLFSLFGTVVSGGFTALPELYYSRLNNNQFYNTDMKIYTIVGNKRPGLAGFLSKRCLTGKTKI